MADNFEDDFLTCAVCYCLFDDPRRMSCGHTFCRSCLQSFAATHTEATRAKCVPCPFCRQLTEAPDPLAPKEEWVGQLESGSSIQEVSEMAAVTQNIAERDNNTAGEKLTTMVCEDHKRHIILFCKDCGASLCPSCREQTHSLCQTVVPIQSIMPDITAELCGTKDRVERASELINERIKARRQKREDLRRSKELKSQKIQDMCQKAVDAIREKAKKLLEDLETETEEQACQIQLGVRLSERTVRIQKQQSHLINKTLQFGSDIDKYNMFKICTKLYSEDEGASNKAHLNDVVLRNKMETIESVLDDVLGSVDVVSKTESSETGLDLDEDGVIGIRLEDDEVEPFPVDVAMVSFPGVHALVVTDNSNCSVKSFYINDNARCHSRYSFTSSPWGLSRLMSNQILVALPDSKHIARLKVTPDLAIVSKMTASKPYRSVAALGPSTIAAGSSSSEEPCVDILDINGHILKSFTSHFPVENPSYLTVMGNCKLLVSDFSLGSVTCITTNGRMEFTYRRGLQGPSGVVVSSSGGIVIVDREEGSLVQYDSYDKYTVQRPEYTSLATRCEKPPWGICKDWSGRYYVTQGEVIRVERKLHGIIEKIPSCPMVCSSYL